jgi:hypothetical protein
VLRRRGADGQARGGARHRPDRAEAASTRSSRVGSSLPARSSRGSLPTRDVIRRAARSRLPSPRRFHAKPSGSRAVRATRPAERAFGVGSASRSASRTSATRRDSTTTARARRARRGRLGRGALRRRRRSARA